MVGHSQHLLEFFRPNPSVLQDLREKLRPDALAVVKREEQRAAIGMGEKPVTAPAAYFAETDATERAQHTARGQLGELRHALPRSDPL